MISSTSYIQISDGYVQDILDGVIPSGQLVRAACERHVRDMARQNTEAFPYYFDPREAQDVCEFFPLALRHSKGEFAGLPFELQPWQIFIRCSLFGWKRCADHTRRFRRCYESVARKNGKSTDAAGIALYGLCCDGEPGAEIYVSATKKDQAKCVFTEAERMRKASPDLMKISKNHINNIFVESTNSFFRAVSSVKSLDGPNPHICIFDELHAWTHSHRRFYETMITGGASRRQPMQIIITTAGDDKSEIWLDEYRYCKEVVRGNVIDESMFVYCAEIDDGDDPLDEAVWIKANPNLGVSVDIEYLRQQAQDAKNKPSFYSVFISKHCNKITSANDSAFDMEQYDACRGELSDWADADCVMAGVDLGGYDDLASYGLVARFQIGEEATPDGMVPVYRYEARSQGYIAANTLRDLTKQPFANLIHAGRVIVSQYPASQMQFDLLNDCRDFNITTLGFDPSGGRQFSEVMANEGILAAAVSQSPRMYNEPIAMLREAIKDGRFRHNGDPLLRWAANNAVVVKNHKLEWMYDKKSSAEKIDPIVAVTMAFRLASLAPARSTGAYFL